MDWDIETIRRFDVKGPRYTSYPTAMQFHEEFTYEDYLHAVERSNVSKHPLSLYFHVPFCKQLCYYCACHKIVTNNQTLVRSYVDNLKKEIEIKSQLFDENRPVQQLHFGGGTPSYLSDSEITELIHHLSQHFHLLNNDRGDYSIELDPRDAGLERLALLRGLGFNRVSLGIQDFDVKVQEEINRIQPFELVEEVASNLRSLNYHSLNMDLIYGLPFQTQKSFRSTIEKVIALSPDRISLFNYAHLPERFRAQAQFKEETLPSASEKIAIMNESSQLFLDAGYVFVGMDHFAKPDDSLVEAKNSEDLHRNFQGYTTCSTAELLGFGVSAISHIDNVYSQNVKLLSEYQERLDSKDTVIERGVELEIDDEMRAWVIDKILCNGSVYYKKFFEQFDCQFTEYFSKEILDLQNSEKDGLLEINDDGFKASDKGRLVLRRFCMFFDKYNNAPILDSNKRFSRII